MSVDPQQMAMMLASGLGGNQAPQVSGIQTSNPLGGAPQMLQKLMLMRALQQGQQPPQQPPGPYQGAVAYTPPPAAQVTPTPTGTTTLFPQAQVPGALGG